MKNVKRTLSVILCIVLMLSSAPVLNLGLFKTDASAMSYAKTHTKEYYYAPGTQFITYLATGGDRDGNTAKAKITDSGYTLIDKNLNAGVRVSDGLFSKRDADEVYLGYKTSSDPTVSIRDLRIMVNKSNDRYTCPENGAAYTLVGLTPISQVDNDGGGSVDLNQSKSSADYLHYFATKDIRIGAPIISITINNNSSQSGYETVKYLNSGDFNLVADANRDAGGEGIYTHLTRLPEVDTLGLRSAMEIADTYIANGQLYVDIVTLTNARNNAKKITDSYDNYTAGYEAFSTAYNQAAIDNAKTAIENAIKALLTKLDWTAFNAAVSKANGLNKNDYVDFSSVENALKNAELVKNSFTKQEQVDGETAKINDAVNALVKKSTTSSMVQSTAWGESVFRASVKLSLNNVNIGTTCDYWEKSDVPIKDVNTYQDGKIYVYQKTAQNVAERWNASTATIYVDPDVTPDILSTGINIQLTMPWVYSSLSKARWGVELAQYTDYYNLGTLEENMRSATVTSSKGQSLTYTLCDISGNDMASAETNKDFTQDATIISKGGEYGPYTWYIKGAVPAAGDKAVLRVLGICAAWAYSDNLQKLTEFTDLTIVSVSKTALKKAIYTVVGNESVYTSDSYAAYVTALNEAKDVLNNATAEQTTVDAATAKLNNAINALQATLDMSGLYAARDKANSLNGSDYEDFSEVASLVNMIPNTVFNTQQEVDDYTDRLNYAIEKLVLKNLLSTGSVKSEQESEHPDDANVQTRLIAKNATAVSADSTTYFTDSYMSKLSFNHPSPNGHDGYDLHRAFQTANDGKASAFYVFDRYNNKAQDVSSLGNILDLYMKGTGSSHQHSLLLYDSSYNENTILSYDPTIHTSATAKGSKTGKEYSYSLKNSGIFCDWENTTFKTTEKNDFVLQGSVPDVGDTVTLRAVYRNAVWGLKKVTGYIYYGWVTLNLVTVDSTALRNAIALSKNVLDKSAYSESSYNAYRTALAEASEALNGSGVPTQDNYDAKTTALVNAINALERIQTVTLDSQSATTAGTTSVVAIIGKAMPAITLPTREHYNFNGYFTQPNGEGVQYYNADGSSARDFDLESDVTLYASWSIDTFDIKFVNYDGSVLRSGKVAYNTTPVYSGDTPTKESDAENEYKFIGWDPEIKPVTGEATYTAQFEPVAHNFKYVSIDSKQHKLVCDNCKYEGATSDHNIVKDEETGYYKCTECDYYVANYSVKVNGTEVPLTLRPEMTTEFLVATVTYQNAAKPNKDGEYFVYWKDADTGEIISAYTTYSFFVTRNYNIVPVFATQQEYYEKRAEATAVARMTGIKDNENGTYSLLAEHSVSSSAGPINNHGILYTYDASLKDSLDMDNIDTDGISRATAQSTSTTLTGLFNVRLSKDEHSAIYARPYICFVDNDGKITYKYGEVKEYSLADIGTQSAESDVLSTSSYDLSDISAEEPITPTEPTEKNPLEKIADLFARLVEIIKTILSFFGLTGVAR